MSFVRIIVLYLIISFLSCKKEAKYLFKDNVNFGYGSVGNLKLEIPLTNKLYVKDTLNKIVSSQYDWAGNYFVSYLDTVSYDFLIVYARNKMKQENNLPELYSYCQQTLEFERSDPKLFFEERNKFRSSLFFYSSCIDKTDYYLIPVQIFTDTSDYSRLEIIYYDIVSKSYLFSGHYQISDISFNVYFTTPKLHQILDIYYKQKYFTFEPF